MVLPRRSSRPAVSTFIASCLGPANKPTQPQPSLPWWPDPEPVRHHLGPRALRTGSRSAETVAITGGPGRDRTSDRATMSRLTATPSSRNACRRLLGSLAIIGKSTDWRHKPSHPVAARSKPPGSIRDPSARPRVTYLSSPWGGPKGARRHGSSDHLADPRTALSGPGQNPAYRPTHRRPSLNRGGIRCGVGDSVHIEGTHECARIRPFSGLLCHRCVTPRPTNAVRAPRPPTAIDGTRGVTAGAKAATDRSGTRVTGGHGVVGTPRSGVVPPSRTSVPITGAGESADTLTE